MVSSRKHLLDQRFEAFTTLLAYGGVGKRAGIFSHQQNLLLNYRAFANARSMAEVQRDRLPQIR